MWKYPSIKLAVEPIGSSAIRINFKFPIDYARTGGQETPRSTIPTDLAMENRDKLLIEN